jgi:hypothetical protein
MRRAASHHLIAGGSIIAFMFKLNSLVARLDTRLYHRGTDVVAVVGVGLCFISYIPKDIVVVQFKFEIHSQHARSISYSAAAKLTSQGATKESTQARSNDRTTRYKIDNSPDTKNAIVCSSVP